MKNLKSAILISLISFGAAHAQGTLPEKPKDGGCYALCTVKDEFKKEKVKVLIRPEYKKLKVIPAEYKEVKETVVIKPKSKKFVYVPAKYKTETREFVAKDGYNKLKKVPEKFTPKQEKVLTKDRIGNWIVSENKVPNCESADPDDCKIVYYKEDPAEFTTYKAYEKVKDETVDKNPVEPKKETYEVQVEVEPARFEEVEIPAVTKEITKMVLVKDETTVEEVVPAVYDEIEKTTLVKKGGFKEWREVPCDVKPDKSTITREASLKGAQLKKSEDTGDQSPIIKTTTTKTTKKVKFEALPVFYKLGSHQLTAGSKRTIDEKLYKLLQGRPNVKIRIMSHTDSRGRAAANLALSKRRAKSVVDYLVAKGIDKSRLSSAGFGETQLINNCKDGVRCSEAQHAKNRRTEFEVIE